MSEPVLDHSPCSEQLENAEALLKEFNETASTQANLDNICRYLEDKKKYIDAGFVVSTLNPTLNIALSAIFAALNGACSARGNQS